MKYCAECGQEWEDAFQYCPKDGSRLRPAPPDLKTGQVLAGKYEIVARLGRGPHGTVYRAQHRFAGGSRAIKVLDPALTSDGSHLQRLQAAVTAWAGLRSAHTARLYDLDFAEGVGYFLVEEFIEGESLEKLLADRGPLPADVCDLVVRQISESLSEAHAAGIGHGRLTAKNVLLTGSPPELTAKVTDFGLAPADNASQDKFRLGALLVRLLSGETIVSEQADRDTVSAEEVTRVLGSAETPAPLANIAYGLLGLAPTEQLRPAADKTSGASTREAAIVAQPSHTPAYPTTDEEISGLAGRPVPPLFAEFDEPRAAPKVRIAVMVALSLVMAGLVVWLLRGRSSSPASAPPAASASRSGPTFDYDVANVPGEGEPPRHPHVLVRVEGIPLYIIRDKAGYGSTMERAKAVTEALRKASENLRRKPPPHLALADVDHNRAIIEQDLPGGSQLTIIAVTAADVAGYGARSHHKIKHEDLAQWWLARTVDYLSVFALGEAPRLTTRTPDGAALLRLAELVHQRGSSDNAKMVTRQDVDGLDASLQQALQMAVFRFPGSEHQEETHSNHSGPTPPATRKRQP